MKKTNKPKPNNLKQNLKKRGGSQKVVEFVFSPQ